MDYKIEISMNSFGIYVAEVILEEDGEVLLLETNLNKQLLIEQVCDEYPDYTDIKDLTDS